MLHALTMGMKSIIVGLMVFGALSRAGAQQLVAAPPHYPNVNRAVAIAPSDTIQLLNRIVVDRAPGQRGARVDVHFSTQIPATDEQRRAEQADRLAQIVGPDAWTMGARRVTISICDTRACAETREPPRQWYVYERGVDGVWQRVRGH